MMTKEKLREYHRNYFAKNAERRRLQFLKCRQKPEQKERINTYWKKWYSENKDRIILNRNKFPEKEEARQILRNAKKEGKIVSGKCRDCGNIKVDAHHEDYSKPLEVIWLCRLHHNKLHFQKYKEN